MFPSYSESLKRLVFSTYCHLWPSKRKQSILIQQEVQHDVFYLRLKFFSVFWNIKNTVLEQFSSCILPICFNLKDDSY